MPVEQNRPKLRRMDGSTAALLDHPTNAEKAHSVESADTPIVFLLSV